MLNVHLLMKKIFIFLLLSSSSPAFTQVIQGYVMDAKTREKLVYASIYLNGTAIGTYTDTAGHFNLDVSKVQKMPLTVSAIGYYSSTIIDFKSTDTIKVLLHPKIYALGEVVIIGTSLENKRKSDLETFRRSFLGSTENSSYCRILNEQDLSFNYNSDEDTIKAYAFKPLLIDNSALGYRITFYLDKFEYFKTNGEIVFIGNIIFADDCTKDADSINMFRSRRRLAYLGSRMHFFRSLWADKLDESGFTIKTVNGKKLKYKDLVIQTDSTTKYMYYHKNLKIIYGSDISKLKFNRYRVYFDKDGYYDPFGLSWYGAMVMKRIADWLPYEYSEDL
jgi:hypothetical protein